MEANPMSLEFINKSCENLDQFQQVLLLNSTP
jgi:hypothetical protein